MSMISPKVSKILKRTYINVYTKNNLPLEHGKRKFPGKKYSSLSSGLGWDSGRREEERGQEWIKQSAISIPSNNRTTLHIESLPL